MSVMACVSSMACEELLPGSTQTVDGFILVTAPVPRDTTYETHSAFRERPSRVRLRGGILSWRERPAFRKRLSRGRLKCRLRDEFGTRGLPRGRVCGAPRAACRVFCSRNGFPGRCARAGLHGTPRRFGVRVTSSGRTSRRELPVKCTRWLMWGISRKRALGAIGRVTSWLHGSAIGGDVSIAHRDERACRKPPPWRCKITKKSSLQGHGSVLGQRKH